MFRAVDFFFSCSLRTVDSRPCPLKDNVSRTEFLEIDADSTDPLPDIATTRWHTAITGVYPDRLSLGSDMAGIVDNIPQFVYQRGARIYSDVMWTMYEKQPQLFQFVLTSSDYCKLYVSVISFYVRRQLNIGDNEFMYVPMSFGIISRTPYLVFPRVVLTHLYKNFQSDSSASIAYLGMVMHGVPIPMGSNDSTLVANLVVLRDCGLEDGGAQSSRPLQNAFIRGSTEVELLALFDVLSLDTILAALSALLLEQKVLLVSRSKWSSSFISHLCECLRVLLYPFDWQHVYIPLIPSIVMADLQGPLPFWIASATNSDHIHPLRFLQVPAPVLAGLRVTGNGTNLFNLVASHFPDLNILDLDGDVFLPASQRVDGESKTLPAFPRKLGSQIAARLASADLSLSGGRPERLLRYSQWQNVGDEKKFTHSRSQDVVRSARESGESGKRNSGGESVRRSLSARDSWFGNLFRSGSSVASEPAANCEDNVSVLIQAAVLEALVRILFPYRGFLKIDSPIIGRTSPSVGRHNTFSEKMPDDNSPSAVGSFAGSDRSFLTNSFCSSFGSSPFLKTFLGTQTWDIFVRTTALTPAGRVFDAACSLFSARTGQAAEINDEDDPLLNTLLASVCPPGRKNRDFFFDQLLTYINQSYEPHSVMLAEVEEFGESEDFSKTVFTQLSNFFPNPNMEAAKLAAQRVSDEIGISALGKLNLNNVSHHMFFAVKKQLLSEKKNLLILGVPLPVAPLPDDGDASSRETVSLWSRHSRRILTRSANLTDESKLLGGIPRTCLVQRVPQLASFFLRNYFDESLLRIVFRFHGIARVDMECGVCGTKAGSLREALRGYMISGETFVSFECKNCDTIVRPSFFCHKGNREEIMSLENVVKLTRTDSQDKTVLCGQLSFLSGIFVEVYSARRELRGVISLAELITDLVLEGNNEETNNPSSPVALHMDEDAISEISDSTEIVKISIHVDPPKMTDKRPEHAAPRKPRRSGPN